MTVFSLSNFPPSRHASSASAGRRSLSGGVSLFNTRVPAEVLKLILAHVSNRDLARLSTASKFFSGFCRSNELWLPRYRIAWGEPRTNVIDRRLPLFHLFARRHARKFLKRTTSYCAVFNVGCGAAASGSSSSSSSRGQPRLSATSSSSSSTAAGEDKVIFARKLAPDVLVSCTSAGLLTYHEIRGTGNLFERRGRGRSVRVLRQVDVAATHREYMRKVRVQEWKRSLNMPHKNKALMALKLKPAPAPGHALENAHALVHGGAGSGGGAAGAAAAAGDSRGSFRHVDGAPAPAPAPRPKPWWASMANKRSEKRLQKKTRKKERTRRKNAKARARRAAKAANDDDAIDAAADAAAPTTPPPPLRRTSSPIQVGAVRVPQHHRVAASSGLSSVLVADDRRPAPVPLSRSPIEVTQTGGGGGAAPGRGLVSTPRSVPRTRSPQVPPPEGHTATLAGGCGGGCGGGGGATAKPRVPHTVSHMTTTAWSSAGVVTMTTTTTTTTAPTAAAATPSPHTAALLIPASPLNGGSGLSALERYMPRRRRERSISGEASDTSARSTRSNSVTAKERLGSFVGGDSEGETTASDSSSGGYSGRRWGGGAVFQTQEEYEREEAATAASLFANDEFEAYASMSALAQRQQRTGGTSGKARKLSKKEKRSQRKAYKQQQSQHKFEKWRAREQHQNTKKNRRRAKQRRGSGGEPSADEVTSALRALGFPTADSPGVPAAGGGKAGSYACSDDDDEEEEEEDEVAGGSTSGRSRASSTTSSPGCAPVAGGGGADAWAAVTDLDTSSVTSASDADASASTAAEVAATPAPVLLHRVNVDENALATPLARDARGSFKSCGASAAAASAAFDMTVVLKSGEALAYDIKRGLAVQQGPSSSAAAAAGVYEGVSTAGAAGLHFPSWVRDKKIFRLYYALERRVGDSAESVGSEATAAERGGSGDGGVGDSQQQQRRRRLIGFTATAIHAWEDVAVAETGTDSIGADGGGGRGRDHGRGGAATVGDDAQQFHRHMLLHRFKPGSRVACARVQYGNVFFSMVRSGTIHVLDAFSGVQRGQLRLHNASESIQTMQVGAYKIVGGTMCGCLYVWARSNLALLCRQSHAHGGPISALAFDKHERMPMLVSGGADALVKVWKLSAKPSSSGKFSFSFQKVMRGHRGCIVAVRADMHKIVSTDAMGEVKLWDLDGPNLGRSLRSLRCDPRAAHVLLLPNVYQIITSHPDGGMCIYNMLPMNEPFGGGTSAGADDADDAVVAFQGGKHQSRGLLPSVSTFAAFYSDLEGGNTLNKTLTGSTGKNKKKKWKKKRRAGGPSGGGGGGGGGRAAGDH